MFELENYLDLSRITPLQSSHTQTAADRKDEEDDSTKDKTKDSTDKSGIEPTDKKEGTPVESEEESGTEENKTAEDPKDE